MLAKIYRCFFMNALDSWPYDRKPSIFKKGNLTGLLIMKKSKAYFLSLLLLLPLVSFALPDNTQLEVWVNEAIVSTYTYNFKNFLARQKEIAKYFSSDGWINYSKAMNAVNLLETVKKNQYTVTAVATMPPSVKNLTPSRWEAVMPLLVIYQNPEYQQKQNLLVTLDLSLAPEGQGVRGFIINNMQAKVSEPPCLCQGT